MAALRPQVLLRSGNGIYDRVSPAKQTIQRGMSARLALFEGLFDESAHIVRFDNVAHGRFVNGAKSGAGVGKNGPVESIKETGSGAAMFFSRVSEVKSQLKSEMKYEEMK